MKPKPKLTVFIVDNAGRVDLSGNMLHYMLLTLTNCFFFVDEAFRVDCLGNIPCNIYLLTSTNVCGVHYPNLLSVPEQH